MKKAPMPRIAFSTLRAEIIEGGPGGSSTGDVSSAPIDAAAASLLEFLTIKTNFLLCFGQLIKQGILEVIAGTEF